MKMKGNMKMTTLRIREQKRKTSYDQFIDKKQMQSGILATFLLLANLPLQTLHPF